MRRLSSLGSKHLAHRKGRSALTAIGIVLGVAILFGVLVTNASTQSGVDRLVSDFTGEADVLVRPTGAFDATLPETSVAALAAVPDVRLAVGSFRFVAGVARSACGPKATGCSDPRTPAVVVRGIQLERARRLQPYELRNGRFFREGAAEIVIPFRLLRDFDLRLDHVLPIGTPKGVRGVRIVGILKDTGAGRTDDGEVAFTSLGASRALAGVGAVVSGARLVLDDDVNVESWIAQHENDAGAGLTFQNARSLAKSFQDFLSILGTVFTFFAAITLFVGAFLIYLTLSMAVIERLRVYGTMRALGASRAQVRRVVMAEAVALGFVSTLAGLALGLLIAKGLLVLVSNLFELPLPTLTITPGAVIASMIVGLATTAGSSLIPARRAGKLSPVVAMRGDIARETRLSRAWMAGAVFASIGIAAGLGAGAGALASPLILLGAVLLTPLLLRPLARALGGITNRMARGVGDVAVLHLVKERSRSAYTLALIMVVMAVIFAVGGLNTTLLRAMDDSLDRQFGADIQIRAAGTRSLGAVPPDVERQVRAVRGVANVTSLRFALVRYADAKRTEAFARIIDPQTYFRVASFSYIEGNDRSSREALTAGGAILLPADRARSLRKTVGDTVKLGTSKGDKAFRIAATFTSFGGPPEVVFGLRDGRQYFNTRAPNVVLINVQRGAGTSAVLAIKTIAERQNLSVDTAQRIKAEAKQQFGQFFNIFYAILLVAAIVGLLGLANTLAMSVIQRYREIGILRAVGTTRGQVRRMVLVESLTLSLVAFVLSVPLGLLLSILTVRGIGDAFGFDVAFVYPARWVPVVIFFGGLVAVLAAIGPGRRAARLQVVRALQYE